MGVRDQLKIYYPKKTTSTRCHTIMKLTHPQQPSGQRQGAPALQQHSQLKQRIPARPEQPIMSHPDKHPVYSQQQALQTQISSSLIASSLSPAMVEKFELLWICFVQVLLRSGGLVLFLRFKCKPQAGGNQKVRGSERSQQRNRASLVRYGKA